MSQIKELLSTEELEKVWEESQDKPVLLFKQSTTCPISTSAFNKFNGFLESTTKDVEAYFVKVRETREVSNQIADETGVKHESPQVLLIKNKEVLWHTSHTMISENSIGEALQEV